MGYTTYFEAKRAFTTAEWTNITTAAKAIIAKQPKGLICGGNGKGNPTVNAKEIWLNGNAIDDQCHETFHITKAKYPEFNFCKTARKPYDAVVVAILCIVEHFAPSKLDIYSDGDTEEWGEGLKLAKSIIPAAEVPPRVRNPS
jgi:hypothetical protein